MPSYSPRPAHADEGAGASSAALRQGLTDEDIELDDDRVHLSATLDSNSSSFLGLLPTPRKIPDEPRQRPHPEANGRHVVNKTQAQDERRLGQDSALPGLSQSGARPREHGSSPSAEGGSLNFSLLLMLLISSILLNLGFAVAHFGKEL